MPEYKNTAGHKKPQKPNKITTFLRLAIFWLLILTMFTALMSLNSGGGSISYDEKSITEIVKLANDDKLEKIVVEGDTLYVTPKEGTDLKSMTSRKEAGGTLMEQGFEDAVKEGKVAIEVREDVDVLGIVINVATIVVPLVILGGFLIYMIRQAQNMNNQSMGFGKAKARLYGNEKKKMSLATKRPSKI